MAGKQEPREIERKLRSELVKVRKAGLHGYSTRLHRLEALLWISQSFGEGATNYAKALSVWHTSTAQLGEVYGPVTLALYGIDRNAQHLDSAHRTELAWQIFCAKEKEHAIDGVPARELARKSFVSNEVKQIKEDILAALLQLIVELPSRY